jgi:hypothetical protein
VGFLCGFFWSYFGWIFYCQPWLKALGPVAAVLNMLPEGWDAKVCKAIDDEHGLILITHSHPGGCGKLLYCKVLDLNF